MATGKVYNIQPNQTISVATGAVALTMAQLLIGLFQSTTTLSATLSLPTGTLVHNNMPGGATSNLAYDQCLDWSVINTGS